ncbi:MAG: 16S rRNA (uracil(1498)-N(3))-methyltransferase [Tannerella sp.]|jgi:16S rRNA (uracil1498-N3)-methyltransferase|nr:16S rRNA (uracil(1498)-N(3))-methyltransferase [Tannerella sp.]
MYLFYAPEIETSTCLPEEESAHAVRVMRLGMFAEIQITDGKGMFYRAVIVNPSAKCCEVKVTESFRQLPLWPVHIHIAIAPPKQIDRMEWFAEKATEIGVNAITCLHCRYSERKDIKTSRIEKIIAAAMKQSLQAQLPLLTGMTDFRDFIRQPYDADKYIAHCDDSEKVALKDIYQPGNNALVLIGPEGGFSREEIELAKKYDFQPVSLGNSRLRTETAAFVACHTIQVMNN